MRPLDARRVVADRDGAERLPFLGLRHDATWATAGNRAMRQCASLHAWRGACLPLLRRGRHPGHARANLCRSRGAQGGPRGWASSHGYLSRQLSTPAQSPATSPGEGVLSFASTVRTSFPGDGPGLVRSRYAARRRWRRLGPRPATPARPLRSTAASPTTTERRRATPRWDVDGNGTYDNTGQIVQHASHALPVRTPLSRASPIQTGT